MIAMWQILLGTSLQLVRTEEASWTRGETETRPGHGNLEFPWPGWLRSFIINGGKQSEYKLSTIDRLLSKISIYQKICILIIYIFGTIDTQTPATTELTHTTAVPTLRRLLLSSLNVPFPEVSIMISNIGIFQGAVSKIEISAWMKHEWSLLAVGIGKNLTIRYVSRYYNIAI